MLFKSKPKGTQYKFSITGLDCSSCAVDIDLALEELDGVHKSNTIFAKNTTQVDIDENLVKPSQIIHHLKNLGYTATVIESK